MNEKVIIAAGIVLIIIIGYVILKLCNKFRKKVYQLFIIAEKNVQKGEKMDYVIDNIYLYIPKVIRIFISKSSLRWILQKMFNVVSDFLNDGKVNGK